MVTCQIARSLVFTSRPSRTISGFFSNNDLFHHIALTNLIDDIQTLDHFPEHSVISVQMACGAPRMADEELRTTGVASGMSHGQDATVVILVVAAEFAFDCVARTSVADPVWASALYHEIWYHPVKCQTIVKPFFRKGDEVLYGVGRVFLKETDLHDTLVGMYLCCFHSLVYFWPQVSTDAR